MTSEKEQQEKTRLHPRNKNRDRYDLEALVISNPELKDLIMTNRFGIESIDFSDPQAVKTLNKALLNHYYGIENWSFPDENLCPAIPGRADYLHYMADLLAEDNLGKPPIGDKITCLDVGMGASCIYPLIGIAEYGWKFIGSEIDQNSMDSAQKIIDSNPLIKGKVECRLQKNANSVFKGILSKEDKIDITICNPPFHASMEDAQRGTLRKTKNLTGKIVKNPVLNFSGISHEIICEGGEYKFIETMIKESEQFAKNCFWFSTLVSKQSHLDNIHSLLEISGAYQFKAIPMGTGNKTSRILVWSFLSSEERKEWRKLRWNTNDIV